MYRLSLIESYIDNVRTALYSKVDNTLDSSKNMPKKPAKIKFSVDNYQSENVFSLPEQHKKKKNKHKQGTSSSDDVFVDSSKYTEEKINKLKIKKRPKKRKIEVDFNSEELCPSTSETSDLNLTQKENFAFKKLWRKTTFDFEEDYVFDLNEFFSTKEPTLNESFTESHSGIEHEFLSDGIRDVHITSASICEKNDSEMDISENNDQMPDSRFESDMQQSDENYFEVGKNLTTDSSIVVIDGSTHSMDEAQRLSTEETTNAQPEPDPVVEISSSEDIISSCIEIQENLNFQIENKTYKHFNVDSQKLVILEENSSVPCFGLCTLKVLHGKLEILGCIITKQSKEVNLYSPRGSSLLVIKNITDCTEENDFAGIQTILDRNERLKHIVIENTSVVFICSKLEDCKIPFLEKYISQQIFPRCDTHRMPQITFDPDDKLNITLINPQWERIIESVASTTKLMIAGGKGVGKSTFLRYAINKLLNRYEKVRIIDLDPGQSEFSVPGCIHVLTVSEPVLGPNYTHLQRTERSYLSNINVGKDPKSYLLTVRYLMESLHTMEDIPTLINYMGFATGIGLYILSSAITFIKPSDVVQIDSSNSKKNFAASLTVNTVKDNCGLLGGNPNDVNFNLIKINSMSDERGGWSLEPRQNREMCVLAYFGEAMKTGAESLISHLVPMYEIALKCIKITDSHGQKLPPAAVNANMVALCSTTDDPQIFSVLGYGVVRAIDLQAEKLVLITPEPKDILENVFYLVLTSVSLPPSVYMTSDDVTGPIPYVMEGELEDLGQITKRSYIPANKK